jgi:hypothetical protein
MFLAKSFGGAAPHQSLIEESRAGTQLTDMGGSHCRKYAGLVLPQRPEQPRWR